MTDSMHRPSKPAAFRPESLGWYSLAAGAALVGAGTASGAVITTSVNTTYNSGQQGGFPARFNVDGEGGNDFTLDLSSATVRGLYSYTGTTFGASSAPIAGTSFPRAYAAVVGPGQAFGPSDVFLGDGSLKTYPILDSATNQFGQGRPFPTLDGAYVGFRIISNGETNYGLLQLSYDNFDEGGPNDVTIGDILFETTPDTAIVNPVPEPGSLALLAAGAMAMSRYRGRRAA